MVSAVSTEADAAGDQGAEELKQEACRASDAVMTSAEEIRKHVDRMESLTTAAHANIEQFFDNVTAELDRQEEGVIASRVSALRSRSTSAPIFESAA